MNDKIDIVLKISLIMFGTLIIYEIIRSLQGGSWSTEELVLAMLAALVAMQFASVRRQEYAIAEIRILIKSFNSLAADFKLLRNDFSSHMWHHHKK